jgi:ribonuclease III
MSASLADLEARIGHSFRDPSLLRRALTHPSLLPERPDITESNQRLEFLGDAVVQLVLTQALFELFPKEREGALSKHRAALANGGFLAQIAREIGLDRQIQLGASEESAGGRDRPAALEDAFEALMGAVYLDAGFAKVQTVILRIYGPLSVRLAKVQHLANPKGLLQELFHPEHGTNALRYEVVSTDGVDHARNFEVTVYLLERALGTGRGSSKKAAEESAARAALNNLPKE